MPRDKDLKRVVRTRMAKSGERYTEARAAIHPGKGRTGKGSMVSGLVEVEIPADGIRVHLATGQHCVVLTERGGARSLPIWIGITEANAIAVALSGMAVSRPLTSDLIVSTIRALGGEVDRVVITRVSDGVFYAEVQVRREGSAVPAMDARPSDALGVAVRTGAPILVAAEVMDADAPRGEMLPDAVSVLGVRVRQATGADITSTLYTPVDAPTHIVVDAADHRVLALLRFPAEASEQPVPGTLLRLGMGTGAKAFRVEAVDPAVDGLVRLRVTATADEPPAA
ncbi:MAG: bifunctional nuclease family protein [Candidatus Dormibacteria bacterium]